MVHHGYGILNEVYYPRIDIPQVRDLGFIVADGNGFWVEVKRLGNFRMQRPARGIPALEYIHEHDRFELRLRIAPDPERDVLLMEVALTGDVGLRPYALLAPHLGGTGHDNLAEAGVHHGRKVLWAEQGPFGLALAAANEQQGDGWGPTSAGYVGSSDGWQDFARNGALSWHFDTAGPGNVALIGELPVSATLALGFGTSRDSAATLAFSSLRQPFSDVWDRYVAQWHTWCSGLNIPVNLPQPIQEQLGISAMVLRVHQDKTYPGAMVASLSVPWGTGHDDIGGYHLVWPRDLVESAGGLLALGAVDEARNILRYLIATQHTEGSWAQNQWLGGKTFWAGHQLDETAFPVLLAAALAERGALQGLEVRDMVYRALSAIARYGPVTEQDRWEEDAGLNAFTLAACVSALVCGAGFLEGPARAFALELADYWNAHIEDWTSVRDTALARASGVAGYYVRIAPPPDFTGNSDLTHILPIKNRACDPSLPAEEQVATDFLQLVRFGLRDPHDPLIVDTVQIVDRQLKVDTPNGAAWRRYTGDGYGEQADGGPFDGVGQGASLAASYGRARPLRARCRQGSAPVSGGDGGDDRTRRSDPGASVGCGSDSGARPLSGQADRLGDAAGLGARGIHQARHELRAGTAERPPGSGLAALSRSPPAGGPCDLDSALPGGRAPSRATPAHLPPGARAGALWGGRLAADHRPSYPLHRSWHAYGGTADRAAARRAAHRHDVLLDRFGIVGRPGLPRRRHIGTQSPPSEGGVAPKATGWFAVALPPPRLLRRHPSSGRRGEGWRKATGWLRRLKLMRIHV